MGQLVAMQPDCVACLSKTQDSESAVLTVLCMIGTGDADFEQINRDLCFEHRAWLRRGMAASTHTPSGRPTTTR